MSLHPKIQDVECKKCSAVFVPFKKDFKCPKCGRSIKIFVEFIPEIITSMSYHKELYGRYFPFAWYSRSASEHILGNIFLLFDGLEEEKPDNPK